MTTYDTIIVGGGSWINGQLANRGAPTDDDDWLARGAIGWGWNDAFPFFRKAERDMDDRMRRKCADQPAWPVALPPPERRRASASVPSPAASSAKLAGSGTFVPWAGMPI